MSGYLSNNLFDIKNKFKSATNKSCSISGLVSETLITAENGDTLLIERVGDLVGVSENGNHVYTYLDFNS